MDGWFSQKKKVRKGLWKEEIPEEKKVLSSQEEEVLSEDDDDGSSSSRSEICVSRSCDATDFDDYSKFKFVLYNRAGIDSSGSDWGKDLFEIYLLLPKVQLASDFKCGSGEYHQVNSSSDAAVRGNASGLQPLRCDGGSTSDRFSSENKSGQEVQDHIRQASISGPISSLNRHRSIQCVTESKGLDIQKKDQGQ